ncbi:MAG: trypsin-like peptidase domain-containing protein [Bacteroides sp.]|nr:trypsin-like peptidase domain-containing protein [Bacteroides sp.]MBS4826016.1 trypsin-like peptidase domain-containing protein [Bacteroides sp.]
MRYKQLFLVVCMIIFSACKPSLKDIVKDTEQATFIIYTYDEYGTPKGTGSGFFIDRKGTGITNYHVLDGAVKAVLKTSDGERYEIDQVVASDRKWDIAKFTIKNNKQEVFPYLKFADKKIEKGDKAYNISSPLGLEASISEGIVSSLRSDGQHGNIVQITTPISQGSSGSALLNENGKVFAVATFKYNNGENLNFGVMIDEEKLELLNQNEFEKRNAAFNKKDNFIILNVKNNGDQNIVLNALEFKKDVTIAYFSYTNLDMSVNSTLIWAKLGEGDNGFLIHDLDKNKKYYITSSSIGPDKENGTVVPLASNYKFKVFFPAIKDIPSNIDIVEGYTSKSWQFRNICLDEYKENLDVDMSSYRKEYAYSTMHEGQLAEAEDLFLAMLDEEPDDLQALNALGIISFVLENYSDAEDYFSKAIETHPNNRISYLNRSQIYQLRGDNQAALRDLTQAVNSGSLPDDIYKRALLYVKLEEWQKAELDLDRIIKTEDYKRVAEPYVFRVICKMQQGRKKEACRDIEIAYNLTTDKDLEQKLQSLWDDCGCY